MKLSTVLTLAFVLLVFPAHVHAQKIVVTATSHTTSEYDYTTQTPQTSNTGCQINGSALNCNSTAYGGGTQTNAIYRFNQIVTAIQDGKTIQYTLTRTARWRWSSTDSLIDGDSFAAEIKGKHMLIHCRRGGNQGKKETLKYEILDIRPIDKK